MQCPVCRAHLEQGPACRRCRADLSELFQLEEQREQVMSTAYHAAAHGQWQRALALARGPKQCAGVTTPPSSSLCAICWTGISAGPGNATPPTPQGAGEIAALLI